MTAKPKKNSPIVLLLFTGLLAIGAGILIAALLLFSTGRSGDAPKGPFQLGSVQGLRDEVEKSAVYIADPTGGEGLWLELRDKELVAVAAVPPGNSASCTVRWRDSIKAFEDCKGKRWKGDELATYRLRQRGDTLFVDTRETVPPAAPAS